MCVVQHRKCRAPPSNSSQPPRRACAKIHSQRAARLLRRPQSAHPQPLQPLSSMWALAALAHRSSTPTVVQSNIWLELTVRPTLSLGLHQGAHRVVRMSLPYHATYPLLAPCQLSHHHVAMSVLDMPLCPLTRLHIATLTAALIFAILARPICMQAV